MDEGEADIVTLGDSIVRMHEPLVIDPPQFEMMQRYLLPLRLVDAVTCSADVSTPL